MTLAGRRILLIISGGIAAYKSLELIRRLREQGCAVRCVLTKGGAQFVTPLSVAALSEDKVYQDLWSLTDEQEMGHIRLSREADLIVVAPASANLLARMAHGMADDLASTVLLAANKPILIAPAMNHMMWAHPATQANLQTLQQRGVIQVGPGQGAMACNETGMGRMAEVTEIMTAIAAHFAQPGPLSGKRALVTSGPTYEPIDPVRFIGNRSSGKQGHAIAAALAAAGADVTLVTGPTVLVDPPGVHTVHIETAQQMLVACQQALPADIAICAAAVADWKAASEAAQKLKKGTAQPLLMLAENPDILATLAAPGPQRPQLVIGFAAETDDVLVHATAKLARKGCDWLLANQVGPGQGFGTEDNQVTLLRRGQEAAEPWPVMNKADIARKLVEEISRSLV
jgi:phosphopantothenoylcysteine decarboxylase/phosphopantothenate--cysteine ligase